MTIMLERLNAIVWGAPALILIISVGIYLTLRLRFAQLTLFPEAVKVFFAKLRPGKTENGKVSSFQALCTALGATVGTGNLVGVAGAICLGGPGAVFWMWVCGILGMVTKFAEVTLAVFYRRKTRDGYLGGPMYVIRNGLGKSWEPMAKLYCLFGVIASFGVGNATQINSVITGVNSVLVQYGKEASLQGNLGMGLLLAVLLGRMLLGGARRIGEVAQLLVPFAALGYIMLCAMVLLTKADALPSAFAAIVQGAFSPRSVTGGMLGSAFQALRVGCSRGVFTNEAGMGTAAIAHASADTDHPVQQGLMGVMEVFLDTIVICTLTALVILVTGVPISYGKDPGTELTTLAFASVFGEAASVLIVLFLILFAVATVLGWSLYGARCAQYLFGSGVWKYVVWLQIITVVLSSAADTAAVWQLAELVNGLMVIPNLISLAMLTPELVRLTKDYRKSGRNAVGGGNNADLNQCKPL